MIYFTGDTHGLKDAKKIKIFKPQPNSKLIVLGDWGGLFYNDYKKNFPILKQWIKWQKSKKFQLYVLLGNHENYDLIKNLPTKDIKTQTDKIKAKVIEVKHPLFKYIMGEIYILENGIHIIDNKRILAIRGAVSIDKHMRTEGVDWWKEEVLSFEEKQEIVDLLKNNTEPFDYIISHTAPESIAIELIKTFGVDTLKIDEVSIFLEDIYQKYLKDKFKHWYFGHFHVNWNYGKFTCLYEIIDEVK